MKVSVDTTLKEGLVVGMRSMPGNLYDGHTLGETIEQVEILADKSPGKEIASIKDPLHNSLQSVIQAD